MGSQAVLRGSLVTALWVPNRVARDIDFVVQGEGWSASSLKQLVATVVGPLAASFEPIWAESPWPGWRVHLSDGAHRVQVDFGWGDPLAIAPERQLVHQVELPVVVPEVMLAWKIHGLVELGPRGRWSAKTLADLVLIHQHARLDAAKLRAALALSFSSRQMHFGELDGFLDDPTWGQSRGSRKKWRSFRKKCSWAPFELSWALEEGRRIVRPLVRGAP
jgi:hypothetical protein